MQTMTDPRVANELCIPNGLGVGFSTNQEFASDWVIVKFGLCVLTV